MSAPSEVSDRGSLAALHPIFALTGVLHAVIGALLPSLAMTFRLSDAQSGSLALSYFLGVSIGALLCVGNYVRLMTVGFSVVTLACFLISAAGAAIIQPLFFILGIGVGIPMTAVSMYAGRRFGARSAAPLTFLNFSWSAGAFLSPLLAARVLINHTYRLAYGILGLAAVAAALACWFALRDSPQSATTKQVTSKARQVWWVVLFACLTFLEVGIENTTATWLATYALRSSSAGLAPAAASSALYWCGFLISRGCSSLVLLRVAPARALQVAVAMALVAAGLLLGITAIPVRDAAMVLLGAALAPIFPLLLARFFAGAAASADSRWLLAICGFGGSVLPWLTGLISAHAQSLRIGLITIPAALLIMLCTLAFPASRDGSSSPTSPRERPADS